jgi:carbamoyl-phosphate synthase large subunit
VACPDARTTIDPSTYHVHSPRQRIIVQFGGQTPLNLPRVSRRRAPIIGTSVDSIGRAGDRTTSTGPDNLNLRARRGIARSLDEAVREASRIGYPVLIRPSYVLGGRGMEICQDETALRSFIGTALKQAGLDDAPVLIDKFLAGAIEVDVDVVADFSSERDEETKGRRDAVKTDSESGTPSLAVVAGIMEQIEQAGIHSGDSACSLPPASLSPETITRIEKLAKDMAKELRVNGLRTSSSPSRTTRSTSWRLTPAPPAPSLSSARPRTSPGPPSRPKS